MVGIVGAARVPDDELFFAQGSPDESRALFERVAVGDDFVEFLTLPAYARLEG
jgi:hypothetical protein